MERQKVTATIITYNEESNIEDCLKSLSWADEIVVVDSESTDRTVELANKYTSKVFNNPWPGHKQQKNFAIDKSSHEWIFSLDADERVTPDLRDYILLQMQSPSAYGYRFPRLNHFIGKQMRHGGWYPDHVIRLFRKDKGRFGGINPHDKVEIPDGDIVTSKVPLIHFTYNTLGQYLAKQDFYSTIAAREKYTPGKNYYFAPAAMAVKFFWKFFEVYILKLGILDGAHGFVAAVGSSCLTFWKYAKLWELSRSDRKADKSSIHAFSVKLKLVYRAWRYRLKLDPAEIEYIRKNIPAGSCAIDIGAHKGAYAYWMLKSVGPGGQVICFEPQPALASRLRSMLPGIDRGYAVVENMGLADREDILSLNIPGNKPSPGATFVKGKISETKSEKYDVSVTSLDSYLELHPLKSNLSFIKCDVEGFELEVFKGAESTLRKYKPVLLFECEQRHMSERSVLDVFEFLKQLGYSGYFFWHGQLSPLDKFILEKHQVPGIEPYANNFVFRMPR